MEHEGDIKGYNDFIEFCGKFEYNSQSSIQMDNLEIKNQILLQNFMVR